MYSDVFAATFPAAENLRGAKRAIAKFDNSDGTLRVKLATSPTVGGQLAVAGLIWSLGAADIGGKPGDHIGLALGGQADAPVGAAVQAGQPVTTDGLGRVVPAVSGDFVLGQALSAAGNVGEFCTVLLDLPAKKLA
jgi:hypothetical protein